MKVLYLDCRQGVSGDMLLSALLNLSDGRNALESGLAPLGLNCFRLSYPKRKRGGIEAPGVIVEVEPDAPHFDNLKAVFSTLDNADLPLRVRERARATFAALAEGEATAHNVAVGYSRFHEVGAVDAVVDIVGTALLVELINPDEIIASPIRVGFGSITAAHGRLPVPAPATAAILAGAPIFSGEVEGEFTTPTGAALVKTLADRFGPMPEMTLGKTGYGPGAADPSEIANALAAYAGVTAGKKGTRIAIIEANVDDMTGEAVGHAATLITAAGALDVFVTPVNMKKGRPGVLLTVLAEPERVDEFAELVLARTSTFGVRFRLEERRVLPRKIIQVDTKHGPGRVKVGYLADGTVKLHPEYDSASKLAEKAGVPLTDVYEALSSAAENKLNK